MVKVTNIVKKATINDVAKLAKVGKTSVSRYLNREFDVLSEAIKERIALAIKQLDYRPNQMARSLKRGGSKLIAYVIPDITNPYSIEVMQGLEQACQDHGYTLLVCNTNKDTIQEKYYLQLLVSYNVEGVLFHTANPNVNTLENCSFPVVLVDRKINHGDADIVGLDNHQSSSVAINHMIDNGFEAILFITEPINGISTRIERIRRFNQLVSSHQNMVGRVAEVNVKTNSNKYNDLLDQYIEQFGHAYPSMRKAIVSINGSLTLQISLAMKRLNLVIGQDIGLLGFDDPQWAAVVGEGITSIRQPTYKIGYSAFELLLNRIKGNKDLPRQLLYPGELIIRNSTQ